MGLAFGTVVTYLGCLVKCTLLVTGTDKKSEGSNRRISKYRELRNIQKS